MNMATKADEEIFNLFLFTDAQQNIHFASLTYIPVYLRSTKFNVANTTLFKNNCIFSV